MASLSQREPPWYLCQKGLTGRIRGDLGHGGLCRQNRAFHEEVGGCNADFVHLLAPTLFYSTRERFCKRL